MLTTHTNLEHSTSQSCFHPHSTLCSSSAKSSSLPRPLSSLCYTPHTDSPWHAYPLVAIHWHYMLLIAFLESFPLVQEVSGILAALISEASQVATLLGTVALLQYLQFLRRRFMVLTHTIHSRHAHHFLSCDTSDINYILSFNFSVSQKLKFLKCKLKMYLIFLN
jgi:hypothetical protein